MDVARLIGRRQQDTKDTADPVGSLRAMAQRAREAGHPISHAQLSDYASSKARLDPTNDATVAAIAAALMVSPDEVRAAAMDGRHPDAARNQHAVAFLRLTEGRSDREIEHLLGVVAATIRAVDESKR